MWRVCFSQASDQVDMPGHVLLHIFTHKAGTVMLPAPSNAGGPDASAGSRPTPRLSRNLCYFGSELRAWQLWNTCAFTERALDLLAQIHSTDALDQTRTRVQACSSRLASAGNSSYELVRVLEYAKSVDRA